MATIEQDIASIRTAVYGQEVREAIADGIEKCHEDSAESKEAANFIKDRYGTTHAAVLDNMVESKNLFFIHPDLLNVERDGLIFSRSADGESYTISGTSTASASGNFTTMWLFGALNYDDSVLPEGDYAFTFSDLVNVPFITIKQSAGESGSTSYTVISHSNTSVTIHFTTETHVFIQISKDKTFTNASFKCQIERGTAATQYEPHSGLIDYSVRKDLSKLKNVSYPNLVGARNYRCQSGCVAGDLFTWLLPNSAGTIVRHSLNVKTGEHTGGAISGGDAMNLGHSNDITYNPTTQKYYVATMLLDKPVAVLSSVYVYESNIVPVDGGGNTVVPVGIAYDRLHNQYILFDDNANFYIYDSSWTFIKTVLSDAESEPAVHQGIETDGYYLYRVRTDPASVSETPHAHIRTYSMDGHFIEEYTIEQLYGQEIEGLGFDWDNNVFFANTNAKGTARTSVYLMPPNNFSYHILNEIAYILTR